MLRFLNLPVAFPRDLSNPSLIRTEIRPKWAINANCKKDMLVSRKRNKANTITFSNKKWRKWQDINSQTKKIFWPDGKRFVKLRISTRTIKSIDKKWRKWQDINSQTKKI